VSPPDLLALMSLFIQKVRVVHYQSIILLRIAMYTMLFLRQEPGCGLRREMPLLLEGVEQTITSVSEARGN